METDSSTWVKWIWIILTKLKRLYSKYIDFDEYPDLSPIINEVIIPEGNLKNIPPYEVRSSDEYFEYAWLLKRMGVYIYSYKKLAPIIKKGKH